MESPVAAVSLTVGERNKIEQCSLHIFGETDPKCLDAKTVFGEGYGGPEHQIKIDRIELQKLIFRGSLVSDWLNPNDFN